MSTARVNFYNGGFTNGPIQVEGTSYDNSGLSLIHNNTNAGWSSRLVFAKSNGTTVGSNTLVANGDTLGETFYLGNDGTEFVEAAKISAQVDGTPGANDMPGRLVFSTTADGAASVSERMRIDNAGRVLVGTATANTSGAKLQTSDGLTFPATQVASADPNTLDDYEEGSWTPTIGGTATYNLQAGRYTKIGRMVYVTAILGVNIIGTGSISQISGLPFVASGYSGAESSLSVSYFSGIASSVVTLYSNATSSSVQFYGLTAAATGTTAINLFQNSARVDFAGCYITA
jgi:hypothetical protein